MTILNFEDGEHMNADEERDYVYHLGRFARLLKDFDQSAFDPIGETEEIVLAIYPLLLQAWAAQSIDAKARMRVLQQKRSE